MTLVIPKRPTAEKPAAIKSMLHAKRSRVAICPDTQQPILEEYTLLDLLHEMKNKKDAE